MAFAEDWAAYSVEPATADDLPGIAAVFWGAFADSIAHVFGRPERPAIVADLFGLCLAAEPEAFWVAKTEAGREAKAKVLGYVFAPSNVRRVWRTFLTRGYIWRWAGELFSGRLGLGWRSFKVILADKMTFLSGGFTGGGHGDTRSRILSIAVLPEAHGHGIASSLMRAALRYHDARGTKRLVLEARPWNEPALHIYRKYGFVVVGRTRDTQGDWLVMERDRPAIRPRDGGDVFERR